MVIKGQQAFKNAFTQPLIVSLTPVLPPPNITSEAHFHFNGGFSVNYQARPHLVAGDPDITLLESQNET